MWKRSYHIVMQTSIGARHGTMSVIVDGSRIDGVLDILKKANTFHGRIDETGDCQIKGELTTLMRTIPYDAYGRITRESLDLKIKGQQENFGISGTASARIPAAQEEQGI